MFGAVGKDVPAEMRGRLILQKHAFAKVGKLDKGVEKSEMVIQRMGLHQLEALQEIALTLGEVIEPRVVSVKTNELLVVVVVPRSVDQIK